MTAPDSAITMKQMMDRVEANLGRAGDLHAEIDGNLAAYDALPGWAYFRRRNLLIANRPLLKESGSLLAENRRLQRLISVGLLAGRLS